MGPVGAPLVSVDGHVEHPGVGVEGLLGALAVVQVEVDHKDPVQPGLQGRVGRDHHVVEAAESAGSCGHGVVARRPDQAQAVVKDSR